MRNGCFAAWIITGFLAAGFVFPAFAQQAAGVWSVEKANAWYDAQPWPIGFNYVPRNAISYTEMWMDYSFDPKVIDEELALAEQIGFNCVRVVLPFVIWERDPADFRARFEQFLAICANRGIKVMPIFFDDCAFGVAFDPVYGKQTSLIEGWYANGWTPSPGHAMVRDQSTWPKLEKYVKDIMTAHKEDPRILLWDLYNEPTGFIGNVSLPLVEKVFQWARQVNPIHPISSGWWNGNQQLNEILFRNSDVITFHSYLPETGLRATIAELKKQGRPLICTEWLNRGAGSKVASCLPVFAEERVGAMHWGLVKGKTQTDLPWGCQPGDLEPLKFQHDLFYSDLTPYCTDELKLFMQYVKGEGSFPFKANTDPHKIGSLKSYHAARREIMPTSRITPQVWRYRMNKPADNWMRADYDDSLWLEGPGGFGSTETPGLAVGTEWNTGNIWLRRDFELTQTDFTDLQMRFFHDEDIRVYVNGRLIFERSGWTNRYIEMPVLRTALAAFKLGRNVMAVECAQTTGGQGVDVGLVDVVSESRWTRQQAWDWHSKQPWLFGCNFNPSTAINQLEMWQADTFDLKTIDRELGWAADLGMNFIRVYLHDLLWEQDSAGLLKRMDQFLQVTDRHKIKVMFVLLDSCWNPHPVLGKQPAPRPHVHNSGWVQSPHIDLLNNPYRHEELKPYVQGVIGAFKNDPRVLAWDLYNEPGNRNGGSYGSHEPHIKDILALHLLVHVFEWAREVRPSQPLTTGIWDGDWRKGTGMHAINKYALDQSDVITFHGYWPAERMKQQVELLFENDRPMICTEYLSRPEGNTFEALLPFFKQHRIGACNWGLVAGKTQTQYPWASWQTAFTAEPEIWFHDILRPDGTAYSAAEAAFIKQQTGKK